MVSERIRLKYVNILSKSSVGGLCNYSPQGLSVQCFLICILQRTLRTLVSWSIIYIKLATLRIGYVPSDSPGLARSCLVCACMASSAIYPSFCTRSIWLISISWPRCAPRRTASPATSWRVIRRRLPGIGISCRILWLILCASCSSAATTSKGIQSFSITAEIYVDRYGFARFPICSWRLRLRSGNFHDRTSVAAPLTGYFIVGDGTSDPVVMSEIILLYKSDVLY